MPRGRTNGRAHRRSQSSRSSWKEIQDRRQDRVESVYREMVEAFQEGRVPEALAVVLLPRPDVPAVRWSWRNRLILALAGHWDARTYLQWKQVGRQVQKGERSCWILRPILVKRSDEELGAEREALRDLESQVPTHRLAAFAPVAVFGMSQTEGQPLPYETEHQGLIEELPLREVAQAWGIDVRISHAPGAAGFFKPGEHQVIGMATTNLSTWAHELVHAADHRLGALTLEGPKLDAEIVAELGGAVLLHLIGEPEKADVGGAMDYARAFCEKYEEDLIPTLNRLIERTCQAVKLILETAESLSASQEGGGGRGNEGSPAMAVSVQ